MLIIPVGRKPDWRHPPVFTLLLLLINCFIYFGWQTKDQLATETAAGYYFQHGLQEIEFPAYERYLRGQGQTEKADKAAQAIAKRDFSLFGEILRDRGFNQALKEDRLINENQRIYLDWKQARGEFEALLGNRFNQRFALDSRDLKPVTFLTHMFMHANFGHLFGNMLILLLVGYIVEEALGYLRFILFYLIGGFGAASVFIFTNFDHDTQLMGASGAIASLMGMYTVLFGLRKIEFFYWFLIYFDLAKLPAIFLLPVWVVNEVYQKLTMPESNVAYMAHAGGLVTGAALVYSARLFHSLKVDAVFQIEDEQNQFRQEMEKADALLLKLDLDRARQAYFNLLGKHPGNPEILGKLCGLCKNQPLSPNFQRLAGIIFGLGSKEPASVARKAEIYPAYVRSPMPRLTQPQALELLDRFIAFHHLPEAEHLLDTLLSDNAADPKMPGLMAALIKRQRLANRMVQAGKIRDRLKTLFPDSQEARMLS